jgi:adenylosuccinate lyase
MICRYMTPEMSRIWEPENKFRTWLHVEIAVCEGWSACGVIPQEALDRIRDNASFDIRRIEEFEKETHHDVVAFIQNVQEHLGQDSPLFHWGITSSDILDTSLSLLLVQSLDLLKSKFDGLLETLRKMAEAHRHTLIAGRSHGVHGEPTTFGLKLLLWYADIERHSKHLAHIREEVAVGKISGAMGTYATVEPSVEQFVCRRLGLSPAPISTQVLQRERHGRYMQFLAIAGCTVEKIAVELRHLQRTEVLEVAEGFGKGQKGSSAMPHKKNPVSAENLCGLSRVLRGNSLAALENIALWHERDISHSSAERIIIPDSTLLLDYMLTRLNGVLNHLDIYPRRMEENLALTKGLIFSQRVMLALMEKGMDRGSAYALIQGASRKVWDDRAISLLDQLREDEEVKRHLSETELAALFDYAYYTRHVDTIYSRFGM